MDKKECRKCKVTKSASAFYKRTLSSDGLAVWCKPCTKVYYTTYSQANKKRAREKSSRWRKANPDKIRVQSQKSYAVVLQRRLDEIGSKVCICCNQEKKAEHFAVRKPFAGDGLKDTCRSCISITRSERIKALRVLKPIPKEKSCSACGETKPLSGFYKSAGGLYGCDSRCKPCINMQNVECARKNPERRRESARIWGKKNPDKLRAKQKRYATKHPEKVKAAKRAGHMRRKRRVRENGGTFTGKELLALLAEQKGLCVVCETDVSIDYHIDHIIPIVKGGSNNIENIQILCPSCNLSKGSKDFEVFLAEREAA